jgi:glutamate synthase (NADPH/NADH) small chain
VAIGRLERFAADWERAKGEKVQPLQCKPPTGKKVGVIGSGPAGLTVAVDLRREGHAVTLFEAFHKLGGVLLYGIPEFRLPKELVHTEIESLRELGVEIRTNFVVGRTRKLTDLLEKDGYDALFIGSGAGLPKFMGIEGENLVGVYSANEYLTRSNLMRAYDVEHADTPILRARRVAVFGGGNVAMDAARTALRLGAEEVFLIYRRSRQEMPARLEEIAHAEEEGVKFLMLQNAKRFIGDDKGWIRAVQCLRYELGEPDASGRRRPVEVAGSEFEIEIDCAIVAVGNESNPLLQETTHGLQTDKNGRIITDENCQTSIPRVFSGGDIVRGAATVILAMGDGRRAAAAINKMLSQ